ncbi:MAG TPA: hypothetical protein ENK36_06215, partial [Desulfobacterales bacterium]|nr:hypothetical protein [Desulfobacterales bacterium]
MSKPNYKSHQLFKGLQVLILSLLVFHFSSHIAVAKQAVMKKILIQANPLAVKFFVTQNIPVKVIQVEKRELLVALKNVKLEKGFKILGKEKSAIKHVALETLQGNVIAVVLTSHQPYGTIRSGFNKADSSFTVNLEKKPEKTVTVPEPTVKELEKKHSVPKVVKGSTPDSMKGIQKETAKKAVTEPVKAIKKISPQKPDPLKPIRKMASKEPVKIVTPPAYALHRREQRKYKGD